MIGDLGNISAGKGAGDAPRGCEAISRLEAFEASVKFPFRLKLALSFSLLLVALTGTVSFWLIGYQDTVLRQEATKRVRSLARNLATNVRLPMLGEDALFLGSAVESLVMEPDVRFAYVLDHQGKVAYHSDPELVGRSGLPRDLFLTEETLHAEAPVVVEGVRVGTVGVGVGMEHIARNRVKTLFELLAPLLLATTGGIIIIFVLSGFHVKRLENILRGVQRVENGELDVHVPDHGWDELAQLARQFNHMVTTVRESHTNLEKNFRETISALAAAVEARDQYTRDHCERVAAVSQAIAGRLGIDGTELKELEIAAILHDVGKIGVEEDLLGKAAPLNEEDRLQIKRHPEIGSRILESLSSLGNVGIYVRHHHEWYDGSGYPDGLSGEEIPVASRIIGLVDSFDAMASNRVYRSALPREETLRRISAGSGTQFDPRLVEIFLEFESQGLIEQLTSRPDVISA